MFHRHCAKSDGNSKNPELEMEIAKRVTEVLYKHFPGHPWKVEVMFDQGIAKFQLPIFMGATNWCVIPLRYLRCDKQEHVIMTQAGELLERYKVPRSGFHLDYHNDALYSIPAHRRGFHGHVPS